MKLQGILKEHIDGLKHLAFGLVEYLVEFLEARKANN